MKESRGRVAKQNPPLIVIEKPNGEQRAIEFKMKNYPHEFLRLRGHTCFLTKGTDVRFSEEGETITDVWFDVPEVPVFHELSRVVKVMQDGHTAFAARECGCSIHVHLKAVISDWIGVFTEGLELWHLSHVFKNNFEATQVEICIPEGEQAVAGTKE
jgi:hypothetical protein